MQAVQAKLIEEWERRCGAECEQEEACAVRYGGKRDIFTCYSCGKAGRIKRNCPDLRLKLKQKKNEIDNKMVEGFSAKLARFDKWYYCLLISECNNFQGWFLDSGATCHMCFDKRLFLHCIF